MNLSTALASLSNLVFSIYGLITLLAILGILAFLWSDQIKRRWHDRVERKKWEHWNGPR